MCNFLILRPDFGRMRRETMIDEDTKDPIALFRYGVIADLAQRPEGERGSCALLHEKAAKSYRIPGSRRSRVAVGTIRDWLRAYRRGGFEALRPKNRRDLGQARAIPRSVSDLLCGLKDDNPELSVSLVIDQAKKIGLPEECLLAPATVHRLLSRAGLMDKRPEQPTSKDRRRFAFDKAGELWMSDVMHGPSVFVEQRRKRKTYLIALLDDATRVIPNAAFALSENTSDFLPVFKQAIRRRGLPLRLYCDNGAVYRSHHLSLVCAKLGICLIHSRPHIPQGRGKMERWFRSVRMQFLPLLTESDLKSLETLNRKLWAWIEGEYHMSPHKGLDGQTPLDRWTQSADRVRLPDRDCDLDELCLFEQKRKVQKDRTISLKGVVYEADAALVGETVLLRFDPSRTAGPVEVYFHGKKIHTAKPVDVYANCFVRRDHATKNLHPDSPPSKPFAGLQLRDLPGRDKES
jgi:putative transposase